MMSLYPHMPLLASIAQNTLSTIIGILCSNMLLHFNKLISSSGKKTSPSTSSPEKTAIKPNWKPLIKPLINIIRSFRILGHLSPGLLLSIGTHSMILFLFSPLNSLASTMTQLPRPNGFQI